MQFKADEQSTKSNYFNGLVQLLFYKGPCLENILMLICKFADFRVSSPI